MAGNTQGRWYLSGVIEPESGTRGDGLNYESAHLTTHGVIVGMTGSGKTGLGIIALEEALLDGVGCLVIDPKGDMGNLLLNFPSFATEDFRPWIDERQAKRKGITPDELAANTADLWKSGLDGWEIGSDRMRELGTGAGFAIYTPGSNAGVPLNVLGSLTTPDLNWETDAETGRDEIEGFVSSLLVLVGITADPISSAEHILLATLIERAWRAGKDLDMATLIGQVQSPPIRKLGVFELDSFFAPKERTKLAVRLNGLIASPSFASWMQGPALDIQSLFHTSDGRPKASIIYLPHLTDQERQFIVTLILSKVVTWMRSTAGTSDLRAFIYMDEVSGFAPPTAQPPSKKPILTILKQARAHGVGMMLSTQNPVDLDYKAMSNAGTWIVGRLQTERDKARILEGMKSASGEVDVDAFDSLIGDLDKRQFVLHSTRSKQPVVFTTRWAMSFLRGPLTRAEITTLTAGHEDRPTESTMESAPDPVVELADDQTTLAPEPPDGVEVFHMDPGAPWAESIGADPDGTVFSPALVTTVEMTFDDHHAGVNHSETWEAIVFPLVDTIRGEDALAVDHDARDLRSDAPSGATYVIPEARLDQKTFYTNARKVITDHLYRSRNVTVFRNPALKLYSRVGEDEADFGVRCAALGEDRADKDVAKLKTRYAKRIRTAEDQLRTSENRVRELETDVTGRRQDELMRGAGDLIGIFLGGKRRSSGLGRAASRRNQTRKTQERLASAVDKVETKLDLLDDLEDDLAADFEQISSKWDQAAADITTVEIGLEKSDIDVHDLALLWIPISD